MPDHDDDRVSLDGLDPDVALKALLAVDPDAEPAETSTKKDAVPVPADRDSGR